MYTCTTRGVSHSSGYSPRAAAEIKTDFNIEWIKIRYFSDVN